MRKILIYCILFLPQFIYGQHFEIRGRVVDEFSKQPLQYAIIKEAGVSNGATTGSNGCFTLTVSNDTSSVEISYLGFLTTSVNINHNSDLGDIALKLNSFELKCVTISSQIAFERESPIALSTIPSTQIEEKICNKEFPEILNNTPSVHANKQGGGWGDSEIWMRGFDNSNIAVMINGAPVNDMENGSLYWSNWASLSDVTATIQAQRGIGASRISVPSVGGTINIVTKGVEANQDCSIYYMLGNDGYNKMLFSVSTGLLNKGWNATILGGKTWGDGYVQGTEFCGYSYFTNISKQIGKKHVLNLTLFGGPQKHYMRSCALTKKEWEKIEQTYSGDKHWTRFNPDYGFDYTGQRKTTDYNVYHKPQLSLNHMWQINPTSSLNTVVYASWGRGYGYSGSVNSDTYTSDDWYPAIDGILNSNFRTELGTFDYNRVYNINDSAAHGSEMIMTKQRGDHNWYGLTSTYTNQFNEHFNFFAGIDIRSYKGVHTNEILDLYGGDYFIDPSRNDVSSDCNISALDSSWVFEHLGVGDAVYRDYDSHIVQEGAFFQAEYVSAHFKAFLSGSLNLSSYWRYDRLYYDALHARSETANFMGGNVKAGGIYNINKENYLFANAGFLSNAPQFKTGAFMSANTSHALNKNAKNQKAASAELGYGLRHRFISINVCAYLTEWIDKTMTKKGNLSNGQRYYMNMTGVNAKHMGMEFDLKTAPTKWLEISAMFSMGDWRWDSDSVVGLAYDTYGQAITPEGNLTEPGATDQAWAVINMKGVHVGGSAQTTASLKLVFKPFKGFRLGGSYTFCDRNYAYYSLSGSKLSLGNELFVSEPWRIPAYGYLDIVASYQIKLGKAKMTISGHVNNVLNSYYIEKAWNPSNVSSFVQEVDPNDVYYFYSFGRTWTVRLKFDF